MPIYLAYETAVEAICHLRTREHDDTPWRKPSRKTSIYDAIHTKRELKALMKRLEELAGERGDDLGETVEPDLYDGLFYLDELTDLDESELAEIAAAKPPQEKGSILDHLTLPLHILVPSREMGDRSRTIVPHVWTGEIPTRSFIEIESGVFLSAPAFTFLQMATELSQVELIQLAMCFCGFYVPSPQFGRGNPALAALPLTSLHKEMVSTASVFEIDPVCSTRILSAYVKRARGCRGIKQARAALGMVLDHAASHMETALYLLLCMPVRMGGYGLSKPELNPKVIVEQASGSSTCYPDLYWRGMSIDVEYNSDAEHSGPSAHYKDSKRMVAIVCNRITYISIATRQLYTTTDLDNAARGLARLLKHRIRYTDAEWRKRRMLLRAAVLPPNERFEGAET